MPRKVYCVLFYNLAVCVCPNVALGSAKYELVKNDDRVDKDQWHPHDCSNARDQIDDLGLDTGIGASTECGIVRSGREIDAREESIFGKDSDGVDEENANI